MEIYHLPRGGGKTTLLIQRSSKTQIPIVVFIEQMKYLILKKAQSMGLPIPEPILYSELDPAATPTVYVDEAGHLLEALLKTKIAALTIGEDINEHSPTCHS